jgi:hypothetical protein
MGVHTISRGALLCMLAAAASSPQRASAEPPKRFRCHAHLEREPDHKETRTVDATCEDGKSVTAIDGDRDLRTTPPSVKGLTCTFTAKTDGDAIALKLEAVYRTTKVTIVGGELTITVATTMTQKLAPGEETKTTLDVDGTPYTLTASVKPA